MSSSDKKWNSNFSKFQKFFKGCVIKFKMFRSDRSNKLKLSSWKRETIGMSHDQKNQNKMTQSGARQLHFFWRNLLNNESKQKSCLSNKKVIKRNLILS
jgi:hypothetical protein